MLSPKNSPRGKLLSQYVCVRIPRMDDVNIALFDYDRYNTLYYFILNADEQIYMRYGGRDAASQDSYLNLDSLAAALKTGLGLHADYQAGKIKPKPLPKPVYPREFSLLVERTFARNACVECHLIGDFQMQHMDRDGALDRVTHMFRSPDIKTIGITLDVPKGLVVKEVKGAVEAAGMKPGDTIASVNSTPVWTFGDLQHYYDKVDRKATQVTFGVERDGKPVSLEIMLPPRWWWTDIRYRQLTLDPRMYFDTRPLSAEEKTKLSLPENSIAGEVKHVDEFARMVGSHELRTGDIILAVDGVGTDPIANTPELYIRLHKRAGDDLSLDVLRDGARIKLPLKTFSMSFRK